MIRHHAHQNHGGSNFRSDLKRATLVALLLLSASTVRAQNQAPILEAPLSGGEILVACEGANAPAFSVDYSFVDPDPGQTLSVSFAGVPTGPGDGNFHCAVVTGPGDSVALGGCTFRPVAAQVGMTFTLQITCSDDGMPQRSTTASVSVTVIGQGNWPPSANIANGHLWTKRAGGGSTGIFFNFEAPEMGQTVSVAMSSVPALPAGAFTTSAIGSVTTVMIDFTPMPADVGDYTLTFTATDDAMPMPGVTTLTATLRILDPGVTCSIADKTIMTGTTVPHSFTIMNSSMMPKAVIWNITPASPFTLSQTTGMEMVPAGGMVQPSIMIGCTTTQNTESATVILSVREATQSSTLDTDSAELTCTECLLLFGASPLSAPIAGGDPSDILLVQPLLWWPVTMNNIPVFDVPAYPGALGARVYFQVAMLNPGVFPNDPIQLSQGLELTIGNPFPTYYGNSSGMQIWTANPSPPGGQLEILFSINGL